MGVPPKNCVGLVTLIQPKTDCDHLRQWFRHHAATGVSRFWVIACDKRVLPPGVAHRDKRSRQRNGIDDHAACPDPSCREQVRKIVKESANRYGVSIELYEPNNQSGDQRQIGHELDRILASSMESVDWLAVIDPDELVVGDLSSLTRLSRQIDAVTMQTKLFESRWRDGKARPLSAIHHHFGMEEVDPKSFVRRTRIKSYRDLWDPSGIDTSNIAILPNRKLRLHRFRGIPAQKVDPELHDRLSRVGNQKLIDRAHQPDLDVIIGTMRSGSTLLGHVMNDLGLGRYAGETHCRITGEQPALNAINTIDRQLGVSLPLDRPAIEKILHRRLAGGSDFLWKRARNIYLLHRHPGPVFRSLMEMYQGQRKPSGLLTYMSSHYRWLVNVAGGNHRHKIRPLCYYDLVDPDRFIKHFGTNLNSYTLLPTTGQAGWGDPRSLITSGQIETRNERDEIQEAMDSFDRQHKQEQKQMENCVSLYTQLVETLSKDTDSPATSLHATLERT